MHDSSAAHHDKTSNLYSQAPERCLRLQLLPGARARCETALCKCTLHTKRQRLPSFLNRSIDRPGRGLSLLMLPATMFFALGMILLCSTAGLQAEATGETCTQLILAELHLRQQLPLSVTPLANSSAPACERTKATRRCVCERLSFSHASGPTSSCCGLVLNQAWSCV